MEINILLYVLLKTSTVHKKILDTYFGSITSMHYHLKIIRKNYMENILWWDQ